MKQSIAPGAHIELRDTVWRVISVDPGMGKKKAWRCVGVSRLVRDEEALFLEALEKPRVLDPRKTVFKRDRSGQHRAGLLYIESQLRDLPPPADGLYVGHRAAMDVLDFQLEPAWMALQRPRQRILIADAVGLGKTLEAGVLLSELIRRGRARRILVCTTKAMLTQFQKELWARFSIPLVRIDSVGLSKIRAEIPSHHNPFYYYDKTIISIDTLKQHNWFQSHVEKARWDVIVIDEAHNVATRNRGGSMRARLAKTLASRCDSLILLSATPHDGRAESFASLMNMLDPTAIADPSNYTKEDIQGLFVRRFKHDVAEQLKGHVKDREVLRVKAAASVKEEAAFSYLSGLKLSALDRHRGAGGMLFKTSLMKALLSSPAACLEQLKAPLRREKVKAALAPVQHKRLDTPAALREAAARLEGPLAADLSALAELYDRVAQISSAEFSKYQRLLKLIKELRWSKSKKDDRLVIFTERKRSLDFLAQELSAALKLKAAQLSTLHGGLSDQDQQKIVEEFGKEGSKLRLLIASDVASEGLNLHYLCHRLIHFDVPWSLMVFQQRNGRVDRYGQEQTPQIAYMMTACEDAATQGDARILELLIDKDSKAQENLGDPSIFADEYTVEGQELATAKAMELRAEADFEQTLNTPALDPFAARMVALTAPEQRALPPIKSMPSVFGSCYDFFTTGLKELAQREPLKLALRPEKELAEFDCPPDLLRRYARMPAELRPRSGRLLLTASGQRMQAALSDARRSEHAWPDHQLLWDNSPAVHWLMDRMRGAFGRHCAPALLLPQLGDGAQAAIILSGLLSNQRGQPLLHRWYVARFSGARFTGLTPFERFAQETQLGQVSLPNGEEPLPLQELQARLPEAVAAMEEQLDADRRAFQAEMEPRLDAERERLRRLQGAQLELIRSAHSEHRTELAEAQRTEVRKMFEDYEEWAREAMRVGAQPFIQVIAALVGGAG